MKIFLAVKDPLLRLSLRFVLDQSQDIEIAGETGDSLNLIKTIQSNIPDVVLIDEELPDLSVVEAVQILRKDVPKIKIIVFSNLEHFNYINEIIQAGADGFVMKSVNNGELSGIIRSLCKGNKLESPYLLGVSSDLQITCQN